MALDFAARIHALSGFDADSTSDTETGDDFDESAAQWMTDAAREVINILPPKLKMKCATTTTLNDSTTTMDIDSSGDVLFVTRLSANSGGYQTPCREVPPLYGGLTTDSSSLYYASVTDPVYWISSSNDIAILSVLPTPTANQTAIVYHVGYPTVDVDTVSTIANFPDEAEYLVVLYTAIKVAESAMVTEEDPELFAPIITVLKQDYDKGIKILAGGTAPKQSQKLGDIAIPG